MLFAAAITATAAATTAAATIAAAATAAAITAAATIVAAAAARAVVGSNRHFRRRHIARLWGKQVHWEIQAFKEGAWIGAFWRNLVGFFWYASAQVLHHHIGKTEQFYHSEQANGDMNGHRRRHTGAAKRGTFAAIDDGVVAATAIATTATAAATTAATATATVTTAAAAATTAACWARIAQAGRKSHGIGFYTHKRPIAADGGEQFIECGNADVFSAIQGQIGGIVAACWHGSDFATIAIIKYQAVMECEFHYQIPIAALEGAFCFADDRNIGSVQVFDSNGIGVAGRHDIVAVGAGIVAGTAAIAIVAVAVAIVIAVVVAASIATVVAAGARTVATFFAALALASGGFAGSPQNIRCQANLQAALVKEFLCHDAIGGRGNESAVASVVTGVVSIHRGSSF